MTEYTFENLLLNPESPDLKSLVGKEVYYSNIPIICIRNANNDFSAGILEYIRECESYPFYVKTDIGSVINYADAQRTIAEFSRLLKPNGFLILEFERSNSAEFLWTSQHNKYIFQNVLRPLLLCLGQVNQNYLLMLRQFQF